MLPALVVSPIARIAIVGALVAAFGLGCWLRGAAHAERKAEALRAVEERATYKRLQELAKRAEEVTLVYLTQTRTIREKGDTIVKEVPKYVSVESDKHCTVPVGFERVHDAAARNEHLPPAAVGSNDAPSGIALSSVATVVASNYNTCHQIRQQLITLQGYFNGQKAN